MKYGLNDKPPLLPLLLYGLQWWVVSLPCIVIMGVVAARLHYADVGAQAIYLQKLFALTGLTMIVQILWGHRLPIVIGPATILLIGLIATTSSGIPAMYTAILVGGFVLALLAFSGLLSRVLFFFTPRIIAVILILIAFTVSPSIIGLLQTNDQFTAFNFVFAMTLVLLLLLCNKYLRGIWKSLTVVIGLVGGSLLYGLITGFPAHTTVQTVDIFSNLFIDSLDFQIGPILSFLFCFLALTVNELGSIESIGHLLGVERMAPRLKRGVGVQGLANMASGGLGIIGSVDYSLSAGVIAATGTTSRYPLVPAGIGLIVCAFFPDLVLLLAGIASPVMGTLLLYLMASQLSSGLAMLVSEKGISDFESGITVALPLMICLMIAFAPASAFKGFPEILRPILGNGFVMGTIMVIVLEHFIFGKKEKS